MCASDTLAMAVSNTSMKAEIEMTVAMSQGLRLPAAERAGVHPSPERVPAAAPATQRTLIVGSTDIPGPRTQPAGTESSAIRTGTRCTTLM